MKLSEMRSSKRLKLKGNFEEDQSDYRNPRFTSPSKSRSPFCRRGDDCDNEVCDEDGERDFIPIGSLPFNSPSYEKLDSQSMGNCNNDHGQYGLRFRNTNYDPNVNIDLREANHNNPNGVKATCNLRYANPHEASGFKVSSEKESNVGQKQKLEACEAAKLIKEEKEDKVMKAVAEFCYLNMLPLECFMSPLFQNVCTSIIEAGTDYKILTRCSDATTQSLLMQMKDDVVREFEKNRQTWNLVGCSILCNATTSINGKGLISFMVSSAGQTVFLKTINATHSLDSVPYLCDVLRKVISEVGEQNIVQIITNNTAAFRLAGQVIMNEFPCIFWSPCVAEGIDLLLQNFATLPWVATVIKKAKSVTRAVYSNNYAHKLLMKQTEGQEIILPGTKRFAAHFEILSRYCKHRKALMFAFISKESFGPEGQAFRKSSLYEKAHPVIFLDEPFVKDLEAVVKISEPLIEIQKLVDGGTKCSIGSVYEEMRRLKEKIRVALANLGLQENFTEIASIVDDHWNNNIYTVLHALAYIINPNLCFGRFLLHDVKVSTDTFKAMNRLVPNRDECALIVEEIAKYKNKIGYILSQPSAETNKSVMQPDHWWQEYGASTPNLQKLAIRILEQPCTSTGFDCDWSICDRMYPNKPNIFTQEHLNDTAFVHYNLRLLWKEKWYTEEADTTNIACTENPTIIEHWIENTEDNDYDDTLPTYPLLFHAPVPLATLSIGQNRIGKPEQQLLIEGTASLERQEERKGEVYSRRQAKEDQHAKQDKEGKTGDNSTLEDAHVQALGKQKDSCGESPSIEKKDRGGHKREYYRRHKHSPHHRDDKSHRDVKSSPFHRDDKSSPFRRDDNCGDNGGIPRDANINPWEAPASDYETGGGWI